ncbi:hypothetical protein H5P28_08160 [Ruficoccus amylovorans]|uniref:Outer membrane lipoprotein-sorting protein n=1 Tax=Ruficoccus amylovorans TaxID=1804625 RepID=A0A842HCM0_9BACT|nr:hypothetical protein [Ruficoccus amylovorans]MBC2594235.1 hypothetical protein [Ruficoccus amylovorans]
MLPAFSSASRTARWAAFLLASFAAGWPFANGIEGESNARDTASAANAPDPRLVEPIPAATDAGSRKVIEYHLKALGGQEALEAIHAVRTVQQISTGRQEFELETVEAAHPHRFYAKRSQTLLGKTTSSFEGFDGETYWTRESEQKNVRPVAVTGEKPARARESFFLDPCLDWEANGYTFEYQGEAKSKGRKHYLLKLYYPSGLTAYLYFDAKTLMITRLSSEIVLKGTIVEMDIYNTGFEKVDGVWFPTALETWIGGQKLGEAKTSLVEFNPPVEPGLFEMPKVTERWLRQQQ